MTREAPSSAVAMNVSPSNWMAITPRRSGTRTSLSAPLESVVSGLTSGTNAAGAPGMCRTSVAMLRACSVFGLLQEPIGKLLFGLEVDGRVDGAERPQRIEERRADPLDDVEPVGGDVGRRAGAVIVE